MSELQIFILMLLLLIGYAASFITLLTLLLMFVVRLVKREWIEKGEAQ